MTDVAHSDLLLRALTSLGRELPESVVESLAQALESVSIISGSIHTEKIIHAVQMPSHRKRLSKLLKMWRHDHSELPGVALAWALRATSTTNAWHRENQSLELVWTGPVPLDTELRRTDQVLLELINDAESSITIVTFAAYKVKELHYALIKAAKKGRKITLIVETPETSNWKIDHNPLDAIGKDLSKRARILVWPLDKRDHNEDGHHGVLHSKCAIADRASILISSANFTGSAMKLNMELGVFIKGGELPKVVADHIDSLIVVGVLRSLMKNSETEK